MKKFFYVLIIGLLTMIVGCSKNDTSTTTPSNVGFDNVSGVLRDTNGLPIVGALVKSSWASATTDASGNWNLGTAPITINSGNIGDKDDIMYAISITMTNVTAPVAGSNYPTVVYRDVTSGSTDINELIVGKLNVTVTGKVTDADTLPAARAIVYLSYEAYDGVDTIPMATAIADAAGIYTFLNVENGASIDLVAKLGSYTSCTGSVDLMPTKDAYTFSGNLTTPLAAQGVTWLMFGDPDQNIPVVVSPPQISIDGGTTWIASVASGDFDVPTTTSAVILKWLFTRPIEATSYTATLNNMTARVPTVQQGISVDFADKSGNVPFTVEYETLVGGTAITALKVSFATGVSSVYTVDINHSSGSGMPGFLDMITDLDGNDVANADDSEVIFSTSGGTDTSAVGALSLLTASWNIGIGRTDQAHESTITWDPIAGAKHYRPYIQKLEIFWDGTTAVHAWTALTDTNSPSVTIDHELTDPHKYFYENEGVGLMYNVKVRALNSDNVLGTDQPAADQILLSQDANNAALSLTGSTSFSPRVTAYFADSTHAVDSDRNAVVAFTQTSPPILYKTTPRTYTDTISGFYNLTGLKKTADELYQQVTFSAYMSKTQIETLANWDIIPAAGGTSATPVTATLTPAATVHSGGAAQTLTVTPYFDLVTYDVINRKATITYRLGFSGVLSAANFTNGPNTPYTLTNPLFRFVCDNVVDLNGTDLIYLNNSGM